VVDLGQDQGSGGQCRQRTEIPLCRPPMVTVFAIQQRVITSSWTSLSTGCATPPRT
jgi:hypothetical protein